MECPICFKKANYTTHCNHSFCRKCLYRWRKRSHACPLCRAPCTLIYPNTRAMSTTKHVRDNIKILLNNIENVKEPKYKIKYAEKLFNFIWDNRIVIRKWGKFCKTIHDKSAQIKKSCINLGIVPPKILKKTITI